MLNNVSFAEYKNPKHKNVNKRIVELTYKKSTYTVTYLVQAIILLA
jgi:hypothetical protein